MSRAAQRGSRAVLAGIAGSLAILAGVLASHAGIAYAAEEAGALATASMTPSGPNTPRGSATASPEVATPPWRVAGTLLSPDARLAQVVVMDADTGRERTATVKEGDVLEGYRVSAIDSEALRLERNGREFALPVSNPVSVDPSPPQQMATDAAGGAQAGMPSAGEAVQATTGDGIPASRTAVAEAAVSAAAAPPADLQEAAAAGALSHEQAQWVRGQVQAFLQGLQRDERFRGQLEQMRQELLNASSAPEAPAASLSR